MILASKKIKIRARLPQKIKWGVSGCGSFAEHSFLPTLQLVQRSKLVSLYSHDKNRAKNLAYRFGAQNYFDDYESFLNSDIDAVYISSITAHHFEQVVKAAKAGKNILCEQPIAISSSQAEEMIKVCKENKVKLILNHQFRVHPLIVKVKELIDKQLLGKIISISAFYNLDYPPAESFRFNKELNGGGVLRNLGTPVIDILRLLGGEIVEVRAFMDNLFYKSEVEDFAAALLKFGKGGYGNFAISYDSKKTINKIDIIGHKGSLCIESNDGKKNVPSKLIIDLYGERKKIFRKRANKLLLMLRSAQRIFLKDEPCNPSGEDALAIMKIIERIESQSRY
jgi:predicted dehydrogenase